MRGRELLSKYINSGLSNDERFELEKLALDDDFLADAWEGLSSNESKNAQQILARLDKRLSSLHPVAKVVPIYKKLWPYAVAASLALVLSVGVLLRSGQDLDTGSMASVAAEQGVIETMADVSTKEDISNQTSEVDDVSIVVESPSNSNLTAETQVNQNINTQLNLPIPNVDLESKDPILNGLTEERLNTIPQKDRPVPIPNAQKVLEEELTPSELIQKLSRSKGKQATIVDPNQSLSDKKELDNTTSQEQEALANAKLDVKASGAIYNQSPSERIIKTNPEVLPKAKTRKRVEQADMRVVTAEVENKATKLIVKKEGGLELDNEIVAVIGLDESLDLNEYVAIQDSGVLIAMIDNSNAIIAQDNIDSGLDAQLKAPGLSGSTLAIAPDYAAACAAAKAIYKTDYTLSPSPERAKDLYNLLKENGCPTDGSDSFMAELRLEYETWAAEQNAIRKGDFSKNNPAILASQAYRNGKWEEAIKKYREAIINETDNTKKAKHHFSIASILFRKLKKYDDARKEAQTAAYLDSSFGRPYMLIGDMYAVTARSCGDSWNQRLAILAAYDKYEEAKTIDPSSESETSSKMNKYRSSFPLKDTGFMRGVKAGDEQRVNCWIDEVVKVRYRN